MARFFSSWVTEDQASQPQTLDTDSDGELGSVYRRPYFEFLYDWRRSPIEIALQLDSFLTQLQYDKELNPSGLKPQVVGHSFGALMVLRLSKPKEQIAIVFLVQSL